MLDFTKMIKKVEARKRNTEKARKEVFEIINLLEEKLEGIEIDFTSSRIRAKGTYGGGADIELAYQRGYGYLALYWSGERLDLAFITEADINVDIVYEDNLWYINFSDFLKAVEELITWAENIKDWKEELTTLEKIKKILKEA